MDLFDKFAALTTQYESIVKGGEDPFGVCMDDIRSATEAVVGGRDVILAGTNNYLGLTFDPECIRAAQETLQAAGTGTTGSRIANGTYSAHRELEKELAAFFACDSAMVFPTGYQANLGIISGLAGPEDYILIDAHCHASIYDGCRLSGATIIRFRHNSPSDLDQRLSRLGGEDTNKLIIVEGLYSMFGDIAPLQEFGAIKRKHGAYLCVDEAHSVGVFGDTGRGVAEAAGASADVDFIVGTFSKSLGAIGGFCVSSHPKFNLLRLASRPYMFTASLSPANVASVRIALRQIGKRPELRHQLWDNARALHDKLSGLGFSLGAEMSPIIAVQMPSRETAVHFWNRLFQKGIYVNLAIPPGTPNSSSLLRCSVLAAHRPDQIDRIADCFEEVGIETGVIAAAKPARMAQLAQ